MSVSLSNSKIGAEEIANMAVKSLTELTSDQQELLFQTKKEQTFSAILASKMQDYLDSSQFRVLVELKGVDYQVKATSKVGEKKNRNTHDLGVLDLTAKLNLILENKVWYHFDGAKGSRTVRVEKNVREQLKADIFKLKHTGIRQDVKNCFVLVNIVTPSNPEVLPKSYRDSHDAAIKRTKGDFSRYRSDGVFGIKSVIEEFSSEFTSIVHLGTNSPIGVAGSGFLDVFCAQLVMN